MVSNPNLLTGTELKETVHFVILLRLPILHETKPRETSVVKGAQNVFLSRSQAISAVFASVALLIK